MRFLAAIVVGMVALTVAACGSSTPTPTIDVEWGGGTGTQRSTATPVPADPNSGQWGGGTGYPAADGVELAELALDAEPSPGWTLVSVPDGGTQRSFSIRLPAGWEVHELQGIDSYVAEVVGDGVRLVSYYGELSRDLNPADDPEQNYAIIYDDIEGVEAKLLVSTDVPGGFAGISFPRLNEANLTVHAHDLTREQLPIAIGILKSIRILEE